MSRKTPPGTPCLEPNCWEHATDEGRCRNHFLEHKTHTAPWALETESHRDLPSNWKSIRKQVLERDKYVCYICGGPGADSVDHVVPRWLMRGNGDAHNLSNLKAAHFNVEPYCHRNKSTLEGAQAALAARKARALAQQTGEVIETPGGRNLVKFPRATVEVILKRDGGVCSICGEDGADYIHKLGDGAPGSKNLKAVHVRVEPRCYFQEAQ